MKNKLLLLGTVALLGSCNGGQSEFASNLKSYSNNSDLSAIQNVVKGYNEIESVKNLSKYYEDTSTAKDFVVESNEQYYNQTETTLNSGNKNYLESSSLIVEKETIRYCKETGIINIKTSLTNREDKQNKKVVTKSLNNTYEIQYEFDQESFKEIHVNENYYVSYSTNGSLKKSKMIRNAITGPINFLFTFETIKSFDASLYSEIHYGLKSDLVTLKYEDNSSPSSIYRNYKSTTINQFEINQNKYEGVIDNYYSYETTSSSYENEKDVITTKASNKYVFKEVETKLKNIDTSNYDYRKAA